MKNRIKEIRESIGITQQELAEQVGATIESITRLENGTKEVLTSTTMLKISRALKTPIETIFMDDYLPGDDDEHAETRYF